MRKRIHRLFQPNTALIMTIFFLLFGVIFTQRAYADGDVTAPEIRRISFTPSTVENDGVITYTMDIIETETGLDHVDIIFVKRVGDGDSYSMQTIMPTWYFDRPAYSGSVSFKTAISSMDTPGDYILCYIEATDVAGNTRTYSNGMWDGTYQKYQDSNGLYLPDRAEDDKHCYINGNGILTVLGNGTAARIHSVDLAQTTVEKGGEVVLEMSLTKAADVTMINALFLCNEKHHTVNLGGTSGDWRINGNKITLTCVFPEDEPAGTYWLWDISLRDKQGKELRYVSHLAEGYQVDGDGEYYLIDDEYGSNCYITGGKQLTVLSDGDDEAPVITDVKLLNPNVTRPGVAKVAVTVHDNVNVAEVSGFVTYEGYVNGGLVGRDCATAEKKFSGQSQDRVVTLQFPITNSMVHNEWFIERIGVKDSSGNKTEYSGMSWDGIPNRDSQGCYIYDDSTGGKLYYGNQPITALDEFNVAFQAGLTNPALLSRVQDLQEGEAARIAVSDPYIAQKELFDAIQGKDCTLIFYRSNYQWIFNGRDITQPKDIYLNIDFAVIDGSEYGGSSRMMEINFAPNGELPGKANVRIKADYSYHLFSLEDSIYIYYNNKAEDKLEQEEHSNAQVLDDTDTWLLFDVTHNSQFLASKEDLTGKKSKSLKVGSVYKSKQFKCSFKVIGNKTLAYHKPMSKSVKTVSIPPSVKINGVRYRVEAISNKAFKGCRSLRRVNGLSNVRTIGSGAFQGCRSLKKVETGGELTSVGNNAFRGCTSLKSFKGGMFLSSIGSNAFSGCKKLTKVTFSGNSLSSIGSGAFSGCVRLTSIRLPATVTRIGAKAFKGCRKLKSIVIDTALLNGQSVGASAFKGIAAKAVIRVPREMGPAYSALLRSKGAPNKVKVTEQ